MVNNIVEMLVSEAARTDICDALKAYCAMDTLAMVMIWKYWVGMG